MDYKNPRLLRDEKRRKTRFLKLGLIIIGTLVVIFSYTLFWSPYFKIHSVEVYGLNNIQPENINQLIDQFRSERKLLLFSNNNFWIFNKNNLREKVYNHYYFEKFDIKKKWPNRVVIDLQEKESVINWLSNNICYNLDLTGLVIGFCEESGGLLRIKDVADISLEVGEKAIEPEDLDYIIQLRQQISMVLEGKLTILNIEKESASLNIITEEGTEIKVNQNLTIIEQVARLHTLIEQVEVRDNLANIAYIDLRFGEKVYYK